MHTGYPKGNISDKAIFKACLLYHLLKYSEERERVLAVFFSCGELALTIFLSYLLTEYDLSEAGTDKALGLLSKFTAQRLSPVYKFFHPLFQEFVAGGRLTDLEKCERGLQYLQQINTFRKVAWRITQNCSLYPVVFKFQCKEVNTNKNYKEHFKKCSLCHFNLSITEQELLLSMFFSYNLGGVLNLEELVLPAGKGIKSAAKLLVQQCLHLLHLRCFSFTLCLDVDRLLEIANVANCEGFQKLERLSLLINHDTETVRRNFFRTLDAMSALKELDISWMFTQQIKASASTVPAFVQCSQLPGLVTVTMMGWLPDAEDLKIFDIMKEQHPQSRSLKLSWQ
ncbi:LOW QUALITY PROTEIN: baculoviral IAP repeat-containing protein 1 [Aegotheles albertisi]